MESRIVLANRPLPVPVWREDRKHEVVLGGNTREGAMTRSTGATDARGITHHDWALASTIGARAYMEDTLVARPLSDDSYVWAVFDGHGGSDVSFEAARQVPARRDLACAALAPERVAKRIVRVFADFQHDITHYRPSDPDQEEYFCGTSQGSTALIVYARLATATRPRSLWLANLGDSRAIRARRAPGGVEVLRLSRDHRPDDPAERQRIEATGAYVRMCFVGKNEPPIARVNGNLSVSRALGDAHAGPGIGHVPDVAPLEGLEPGDVVVLGCDGVWDAVSDIYAAELALSSDDLDVAAARLRNYAVHSGSGDNVSVVMIRF